MSDIPEDEILVGQFDGWNVDRWDDGLSSHKGVKLGKVFSHHISAWVGRG
jgi:hypothetical protein